MGTPYYMAPEQKTDAAHVDKRADIYAVGVVLFELLTLENTIGLEMPSEINRELPKEIDQIIKRAVATKPENRYGDVREFIDALNNIIQTVKKDNLSVFYKIGSKGAEIEKIQQRLNALGLYKGLIDGEFGRWTLDAVKEFQKIKELEIDGIVGPVTWKALLEGEILERKYADPVTGMEFVFVKGGTFRMGDAFGDGSANERPIHEVIRE